MPLRPPNLPEIVERLKQLDRNLSLYKSPKHVAQIHVAAVGLLTLLKQDQATLHHQHNNAAVRKQATKGIDDQGNDASTGGDDDNCFLCPPPEKIPAMSAVVQDEMLFAALIRCLKVVPITSSSSSLSSSLAAITNTGGADEDSTNTATKNASMSAAAAAVASVIMKRKRSLSLTNNELSSASASKAMKLGGHHTHHNHHHNHHTHHHHHHHHLSPVPSSRGKLNATNEQQKQRNSNHITSVSSGRHPTMNVAVLAATILYTAMAHLDHWPVPLIQAYAEDCFGPRLWVDEEQCRPLVENLALAHISADADTTSNGEKADETISSTTKDEACNKEDEKMQKDSALVAEAYRDFHKVLVASVEENNRNNNSNGSSCSGSVLCNLDDAAATQHFALPFRSSSGGQQKMGLPKRRSSISSSSSISNNMERSTSLESIDPSVRAQMPYEKDSDSGDEEVEEERGIEMSKDVSKKIKVASHGISSKKKSTPKKRPQRDGDSSSSGEDDNEVVMTKSNDVKRSEAENSSIKMAESSNNKSTESSLSGKAKKQKTENSTPKGPSFYPIVQTRLDLRRKRQRYVGANLEASREAIGIALSDRIEQKTKQNSGLLQTLPSFTSVPAVRDRVAQNLEKWLQSPALAGLARTLFAATVDKMKNVDPPLKQDLAAIDCILAMKLKANQLSTHIGNVTAIAKRIPTLSVAKHIYSTLFREQLVIVSSDPTLASSSTSDTLKMVAAVHQALPSQVSYEAMGASLLMLLADSRKTFEINATTTRRERDWLVKYVRRIIRSLAAELGSSLDGFALLRALLSHDVSDESWSIRDEEDKARLMFQCVTLHVSMIAKGSSSSGSRKGGFLASNKGIVTAPPSPAKKEAIRKAMYTMRKLLLSWCCTDYVPRMASKQRKRAAENDNSLNTLAGAGAPDFKSALNSRLTDESIPSWLNTVRCLLLIEEANSDLMTKFLAPVQSTLEEESDWKEELERIKLCCDHGADIDDEMIWIVLRSSAADGKSDGMLASMALQLLEHLFESCGKARGAVLRVEDPDLVWELYTLAQYSPPKELLSRSTADDEDEFDDEDCHNGKINGRRKRTIPDMRRLAYPGYWWRVTMLALVMCGASPEKIGSMVWNEHPTLRSLMKMVTAARYRFPTVDCDDQKRDDIKQKEQAARDEETRIAELLFLPPRRKKNDSSGNKGSRVSRRLMKQQLEKEAAAELAETNKRKKMMRAAQKSIMLWDPDGPARKPPRESADLLLSVEEMFGLSAAFQGCTNPDLLLMTIGQTTRGAIERAYDWLIPIISRLPNTIARLPSNASCFLLLRAYGTDGDERSQLRELSAPLLRHVKESLRGKFGESDCLKAFDLLMSDVASHNPDRRKGARRVLHDSLGQVDDEASPSNTDAKQQLPVQPSAWMTNILLVQHAKEVVPNAIKYMSTAAKFERGRVLKSLVMALQKHLSFAAENSVEISMKFPDLLTQLISQRPSVYAEAIDRFPDFRSVVIDIIHTEFSRYAESGDESRNTSGCREVIMKLRWGSQEEKEVGLPLALLQSTCALLSIWTTLKAGNAADSNLIQTLVVALMRSNEEEIKSDSASTGLSSAKMSDSGAVAVTVESWIMLCKARSDDIGKRAALSAPEAFLARLLLSSGLPQASLLAMVDRLGRLGASAVDKDKTYHQLLQPPASSEWDIGRVGHRRDVSRRLLGRLSAYLRSGLVVGSVSTTFVDWLKEECTANAPKPTKQKHKKSKTPVPAPLANISKASSVLSLLKGPILAKADKNRSDDDDESIEFLEPAKTQWITSDYTEAVQFIDLCFANNLAQDLDDWFRLRLSNESQNVAKDVAELPVVLLQAYEKLTPRPEWTTSAVSKWVPLTSRVAATRDLWSLLFLSREKSRLPTTFLDGILSRCLACWGTQNVVDCTEWIMSTGVSGLDGYAFDRLVSFLVYTSGKPPCEAGSVDTSMPNESSCTWGTSERFVSTAAFVSLEALKTSSHPVVGIRDRNGAPNWLSLLLLLVRVGKKQLQYVSQAVLRELDQTKDDGVRSALLSALLQFYLRYPLWMNVGAANVRTGLVEASEAHADCWDNWRCSFDDQLEDMLESLVHGDLKIAKSLAEFSRKHPLLILRKSSSIVAHLKADATTTRQEPENVPQRGVVSGKSLDGPLKATMTGGKIVQVHVRHWGFRYTEPIWSAILDVIAAVHKEVLFGGQCLLGLQVILGIMLNLIDVQSRLYTAGSTTKLKARLREMITSFRDSNPKCYNAWLRSQMEGEDIRNLLVRTDLVSAQEIIDNLRANQ